MGILYFLAALLLLALCSRIFRAVSLFDIQRSLMLRFLGHTGGIRTQIGDNTHRAVSFYINSFI